MAGTGVARARSYKDLEVWRKGLALAKSVYQATAKFPKEEKFGLVSQMRRAAVSIPSNIAEGQARQGTREYLHFLSHPSGSLAELETQLLLSVELGYCDRAGADGIAAGITELQKMLAAIRRTLSIAGPLATNH